MTTGFHLCVRPPEMWFLCIYGCCCCFLITIGARKCHCQWITFWQMILWLKPMRMTSYHIASINEYDVIQSKSVDAHRSTQPYCDTRISTRRTTGICNIGKYILWGSPSDPIVVQELRLAKKYQKHQPSLWPQPRREPHSSLMVWPFPWLYLVPAQYILSNAWYRRFIPPT